MDFFLHKTLNSISIDDKLVNNGNVVYLVMFRVLNRKENIWLFNYITYNEMFSDYLLKCLTGKKKKN